MKKAKKKGLAELREEDIKRLPELIELGTKTLQNKGCKVNFAADAAQAREIMGGLLAGQKRIVRSFSQTLYEIGFDGLMARKAIEVEKTSTAEILWSEEGNHADGLPPFPAIDREIKNAAGTLHRYLGMKNELSLPELSLLLAGRIKEQVTESEYGITGINSIAAERGTLVLAENEGNGRAVSNLPYHHVVVAGVDKIVSSLTGAVDVVCCASKHGQNRKVPVCISLISGPSRTGDIEFRLTFGMHGPKEVHVILLDNGRQELRRQGYGYLLKCIDCGSCCEQCREMALANGWSGITLTMKGLALALIGGRIAPPLQRNRSGNFSCPVGITPEMVAEVLKGINTVKSF